MKSLELFTIIKRTTVWKNEVGGEYEYTDLGVVKTVGRATDIVNGLNENNKNIDVAYFYKDLKLDLYNGRTNFEK